MMRVVVIATCFACGFSELAAAQDVRSLEPEKAAKIARLCVAASSTLADLPLTVTPDAAGCMGIEGSKRAALVVPDAAFALPAMENLAGQPVPVGILYLYRLRPEIVGRPVPVGEQRRIEIAESDREATISMWPLAVSEVAGRPVLLVYGTGPQPLLVTTLVETGGATRPVVAIDVRQSGDRQAALELTLAGKHRAEITITAED